MKWLSSLVAVLSLQTVAWGDAAVLPEVPAGTALARYEGGEGPASIGWYFTSDAPLKERRVAQTVQVAQEGKVQGIAFKLTDKGMEDLAGEAGYRLVVYEAEAPPEKKIGGRVVSKSEGVLRRGEGNWLAFSLEEGLAVQAGRYYTFVLNFLDPSPENRVILEQSAGQEGVAWRWHQDQRGSWSASKNSLHFVLY